ncbi:MAG: MAPEG family protein [Rhodospirillales bacterium]|nr:MAPEG family protein [Rhodospirillales bacterium]
MSLTPVYAGILALMYVVLSLRVISLRRAEKIGIGDGGHAELIRRQRVHGNFAEYVPLVLVLMTLAELQEVPDAVVHLIGGLLLSGRLLHAWALGQEPGHLKARVLGMILTFAALIAGGLSNLGFVVY